MRTLLMTAVALAIAAPLYADPLSCNLTQYKAVQGMTAAVEQDSLVVSWSGEQGAELRMRLGIAGGQPIVRALDVRRKGAQWVTLGRDLKPEFDVTTGRRRMGFDWTAKTGLKPKFLVAATDTYMKYPDDDVYPEEYANYVKLDKTPTYKEGWSKLTEALRAGQFFVTSGEVLFKQFRVEGAGNRRNIVADLEWTFPLDFVEVVWGDGQNTGRQIISASELGAFGSKRFTIPFDATGKDWVRVSAWDVAANGAFTQPVRLSPMTTSTASR